MCPRCCLPVPWEHNTSVQHGLGKRGVSWLRLVGGAISIDATYRAQAIDFLEKPFSSFDDQSAKRHIDGFNISAQVRWPGAVVYRVLGQATGGFALTSSPPVSFDGQVEFDDGEAEVRGYVEESLRKYSPEGGYTIKTYRYDLTATAVMRISASIDYEACTLNTIAIRTAFAPYFIKEKWTTKNEETGEEYEIPGGPDQTGINKPYPVEIGEDSTPIVSGVVGTLVQNSFRVGGRAFAKFVSAPL